MIFEKKFVLADAKNILHELCEVFFAGSWEIYEPSFLAFATEAEYVARAIKIYERGTEAFLLSSIELLKFIEGNLIGFDWTDMRLLGDEDEILYIQIVDEIIWYARTNNLQAIRILSFHGFLSDGLESLRFGEFPRLKV